MQIVSTELARIASIIGADYMRTMTLGEANQNLHYTDQAVPLMIYNGASQITTNYEGAQVVDVFAVEIYILVRKTTTDMLGPAVDQQLQITKELANKVYFNLQSNASTTVRDASEYTLEAVAPFDDHFIGHVMQIDISFQNEGCT